MQLKLACEELNKTPKSITLEKVVEELKAKKTNIYYMDKSNSHKDLISFVEKLESSGFSVYLREVKFGLDDADYMYELHIL